MINNFFLSPLEQFEILPLIPLYFHGIDFSITNETIILIVIFLITHAFFFSTTNEKDLTLNLIPSRFQIILSLFTKLF